MIANLYIHPDTFKYNGTDTRTQVEGKLKSLVRDMTEVLNDHSEKNRFKVPLSLFNTPMFEGLCICDLAQDCMSRDEKNVFFSIMANTSDDYKDITLEQLESMCKFREDETEINTVVILNQPEQLKGEEEEQTYKATVGDYITFDEYKLVYNNQSWLYLRRQILGNHPNNPAYFITECRKYFPDLVLHDNCITSLVDEEFEYLKMVPRKIIYYLSCLNDKFKELQERHIVQGSNPNVILTNFSGLYGLDKDGSLQQKPDKKRFLKFNFIKESDGSSCSVLCEPHLKIEKEDANCKIKNINYDKFHPRIYFCYTSPDIANGKILIGSIGKHI